MASGGQWYYAVGGETKGPVTVEELAAAIRGVDGLETMVYGPGLTEWTEARHVAALASLIGGEPAVPPPPRGRRADEIDYEIFGDDMQFVEVTLDPRETVIAEAGAMMYMTSGIQMETIFGDASQPETGLLGKLMSAGKRVLTGESLFMTAFTATGSARDKVAFGAPYPGKIVPLHLDQLGGEMLCQKEAFLCAARGVSIGIAFTKRFGAGLFGGEGFILQRLEGDGIAFVHAGGTLKQFELAAGETLRVDTGCLVAFGASVGYDIQYVGSIKTTLFGGEGLFFATLTGPGHVWLQSLPFSRLAGRIYAAAPQTSGKRKGEGSILGSLGDLLDGDNR
ncbi:MAG: TIGR00266 family protein [Phycisphaerae bacterium]|nr:TIGR00266 family protein [Phycisphaerae bacterium]